MRPIFGPALLGAAMVLAAGFGQPAAAALIVATTTLTGAQEVPANASTATGFATFEVDDVTGDYSFTLSVDGIFITQVAASSAGGLHIHNAPAGVNGPVVVNLFTDFVSLENVTLSGFTWKAAGTVALALIDDLAAGNLYVNLHTEAFPGGEIRGQLEVVPLPGALVLLGTGVAGLAWLRGRRRNVQG